MMTPAARLGAFTRAAALMTFAVVAIASCGREPTGVASGHGMAALDVGPLFQATQSGGSGDEVTRLTVTIYLVNTAVAANAPNRLREIRVFNVSADDESRLTETDDNVTFKVEFPLQGENAVYEVRGGAYNAAGLLLFDVTPVQFTAKQVSSAGAVTVNSTVTYVGPGSNAVRIVVTPGSLALEPTQQGLFTATVFAANDVVIPVAPVRWHSQNGGVAFFTDERNGTIRAGQPGTTQVFATIEGLAVQGSATVTVTRNPASVSLASGGNQNGTAGEQLPQPVRVRVVGIDNGPVPGVTVNFAPQTSSGGSVSPRAFT